LTEASAKELIDHPETRPNSSPQKTDRLSATWFDSGLPLGSAATFSFTGQ